MTNADPCIILKLERLNSLKERGSVMAKKVKQNFGDREAWLIEAAGELTAAIFEPAGFRVPGNIRISCGWPKGARGGKTIGGQCWTPKASADGTFEIFILPMFDNPVKVLGILIHELCHTVAGIEAGHGKGFRKVALAVGLTGKMTSTEPGEQLIKQLKLISNDLGQYPHAVLNPNEGTTKKQGTRLIKVVCPDCDYTVRITKKWIESGLPTCPCGTEMEASSPGGDE